MKHKVVAPSVGESITEVRILKWTKKDGDAVKPGEVLLEIETDKATVEVAAESAGALSIVKPEGETVPIGETLGYVDDAVRGVSAAPASALKPDTQAPPTGAGTIQSTGFDTMGPAARKIATEQNIDVSKVSGTGKEGRVTKGDLMGASQASVPQSGASPAPAAAAPKQTDRAGDRRVPMTRLRQRIAERLVEAQHTAAILTTFNEIDMSAVMKVRSKHKEAFKAKNGVNLSFMSFFTRACTMALKTLPAVNASLDGTDIIYHDYADVGIAVGTDRGLVVPVIRAAEKMTFAEIEKGIGALAEKARSGKLSIPEMSGGTFTITNGGTYGSLLSTPILNPPQSAILGMHNIVERPVAIEGKVEIRPMMYVALSYDHRMIDGKEAVTFLVTLKDLLEHPEKLNMEFANG